MVLVGLEHVRGKRIMCEVLDCMRPAAWHAVVYPLSFHWCEQHTVECMSNKEFWRVAAASSRNVKPTNPVPRWFSERE